MHSILILIAALFTQTTSSRSTTIAYLAPTRLEILMTVEQGIHHRVLFAKTGSNAHVHGFSA